MSLLGSSAAKAGSRPKSRWTPGNQVRLLENGEEFFPAVFDAIRQAQREVILETFIVFEDKVGNALHAALLQAARRGVAVDMLVDGFGSSDLTAEWVRALTDAGVRIRSFDPSTRFLGWRLNVVRRMHRKIVVVDGRQAFVGGINYSADHLADFGPLAKQDYAVELHGPIVDTIHAFACQAVAPGPRQRHTQPPCGGAEALFVTRDNVEHHNAIERHYRAAVRSARKRVLIANAYFFPGHRLLQALRRAARRGVDVRLVLQGQPDMPIVKTAATLLYDSLRRDGVRIYEYCKRPLHGKVAVVDDDWATVGSSNLDPLSLSLNLEANVVLRDRAFATHLRERLEDLIEHACTEVTELPKPRWPWIASLRALVVYHFTRHFPAMVRWLPRHAPRVQEPICVPGTAVADPVTTQLTSETCDAR